MSKTFVRYKKHRVRISILAYAFKKRIPDDDESVPFLVQKDLYKDKVANSVTH